MAVNGGAGDDGPPLTELESLQLKANQVTDESLESTRRMITLCEDVSLRATMWGISAPFGIGWWVIYMPSYPSQICPPLIASIQSKEAGIKTLVALDDQGGKCDQVNLPSTTRAHPGNLLPARGGTFHQSRWPILRKGGSQSPCLN